VSAGGRIFLRSDRGASYHSRVRQPPTMIYRLASTSSGAMRQSRRFSDIGRRLCCMGCEQRTSGQDSGSFLNATRNAAVCVVYGSSRVHGHLRAFPKIAGDSMRHVCDMDSPILSRVRSGFQQCGNAGGRPIVIMAECPLHARGHHALSCRRYDVFDADLGERRSNRRPSSFRPSSVLCESQRRLLSV
jgi:hypothetical protein